MCEDLVSGDEFQQVGVTLGNADRVVFVVNKDQVSEAVQLGLKKTRWKRWARNDMAMIDEYVDLEQLGKRASSSMNSVDVLNLKIEN
ncbi:hypothetical protein ACOSP7_027309 [Xanthoceras sorbifolium]